MSTEGPWRSDIATILCELVTPITHTTYLELMDSVTVNFFFVSFPSAMRVQCINLNLSKTGTFGSAWVAWDSGLSSGNQVP